MTLALPSRSIKRPVILLISKFYVIFYSFYFYILSAYLRKLVIEISTKVLRKKHFLRNFDEF